MTIAQFIAWLRTQDQTAQVQVVDAFEFIGGCRYTSVTPNQTARVVGSPGASTLLLGKITR